MWLSRRIKTRATHFIHLTVTFSTKFSLGHPIVVVFSLLKQMLISDPEL